MEPIITPDIAERLYAHYSNLLYEARKTTPGFVHIDALEGAMESYLLWHETLVPFHQVAEGLPIIFPNNQHY